MSDIVDNIPDPATMALAPAAAPSSPIPARVWPPQDFLLAQVTKIDSEGKGSLTVYDADQVLTYPNGQPVIDIRFVNRDLNLKKYEWVVFRAKTPAGHRHSQNGDQIEVQRDSIWRAYEQTAPLESLSDIQKLLLSSADQSSLVALLMFGRRLFLVVNYGDILEERFRSRHAMVQQKEQLLEERKSQQDTRDQELDQTAQSLDQRRLELIRKENELTTQLRALEDMRAGVAERENQIAQAQAVVEQKAAQLALETQEVEAKKTELVQRDEVIAGKHAQLNTRLEKWGFKARRDDAEEITPIVCESETQLIEHVQAYIATRNFHFDPNTIANFYTCLKSGAFVVLSGLSGAGKSSLAQLFAAAIGAKFKTIAVKANWTDTADLVGFYNPDKRHFHSTPFLDTLIEAQAHPDRLYLICLDEMNLSRVEYYLSDLLNVIDQDRPTLSLYSPREWELRRALLIRDRQAVQEGRMASEEFYSRESNVWAYRDTIDIPANVLFCGTVNIDETTQPFSDKVLDRVQIMQFEQVAFPDTASNVQALPPAQLSLPQFQEYCRLRAEQSIDPAWFDQINSILRIGGFHFAHRVKRQIDDYYTCALGSHLFTDLTPDDIVDLQIIQKILPKLRGIRGSHHDRMFAELRDFCDGRYIQAAEKIAIMDQMDPLNYWDVFRYVGDTTL